MKFEEKAHCPEGAFKMNQYASTAFGTPTTRSGPVQMCSAPYVPEF